MVRQVLAVAALAIAFQAATPPPAPSPADPAFAKYWGALTTGDATKASADIVKSGAAFDEVYARLQHGRVYAKTPPTGTIRGRRGRFEYWLNVPASYDASRQYQVRINLHGGVMREGAGLRGDGTVRLAGAEQIYVSPSGWNEAPWWSDTQVENIRAILDSVKRVYNVDENHVVLSGVSDGGTGAYFVAMRDTTPYASILPLNGYVLVLRSPELLIPGDLFLNNLRNKPLFIVNGGKDPLYPTEIVEPSLAHLNQGGVPIVYRPQLQAGHDTSWWPAVKEEFENFVRTHPRVPLPDTLTWETSDTRNWNRAHWLVIDSLGTTADDAKDLPDLNVSGNLPVFRHGRSGRVDLGRSGNTVTARTRYVKEFTLLLSPDRFDFTTNVKVVVNGRVAFDGRVEKSVATLMKWAARDNDRTMLFGAELKIRP
jgi:poly(3-hydroxybutyrate) depolymerase